MKIEGKVAIVTGGTGGLGWRICKKLSDYKMKIVMVHMDSTNDKADQYVAEIKKGGSDAVAIFADATTQEGIDAVLNATISNFGGVDALVLSAAFNQTVKFPELDKLTPELWDKIMKNNLTALFLAMRTIGPELKRRGNGRIVSISSQAAFNPSGSSIAYCVSKAGVVHLTHCMAVALAPEVLVNNVAPGFMEGTGTSAQLLPEFQEAARKAALIKKAVEKDDVADSVRHLIETDSITGQTLLVCGGRFFH